MSSAQIMDTTKFIFENAILEKEKNPDDRLMSESYVLQMASKHL